VTYPINQDEHNKMAERTASISMIAYERLEELLDWMQDFVKTHNEQMQFLTETALKANINPELKKRVYLDKRMDELETTLKGFISHYYENKKSARTQAYKGIDE